MPARLEIVHGTYVLLLPEVADCAYRPPARRKAQIRKRNTNPFHSVSLLIVLLSLLERIEVKVGVEQFRDLVSKLCPICELAIRLGSSESPRVQ